MKLMQWSYTKRYQVKGIFDKFPDMIIIFRTIGSYYFIFTTVGSVNNSYPTRKDYVEMELLINEQMETLPAYIKRKTAVEKTWIEDWMQKKELPTIQLEVIPYRK